MSEEYKIELIDEIKYRPAQISIQHDYDHGTSVNILFDNQSLRIFVEPDYSGNNILIALEDN